MCVDREPHVKVLSEGHYQTSVGHSDGGSLGILAEQEGSHLGIKLLKA